MIHTTFALEPFRGRLLRGDVRIPEGPPPRSAVVVVHGFKGFKDWSFFPHLCNRLAAAGQQMPVDVGLLEDFESNRERLDLGAAAARVEAPWLILHGETDLTVGVEEARALARVARRGRLVVLEGAGHTYEVGHPFERASPALGRAVDATLAHLALHMEER